jgi:NADH:ubiquinone oxidoreductase subunit E
MLTEGVKMRTIEVCVGSSCFLKGAHSVLDALVAQVRRHGLEAQVRVIGAFCMENCRQGVSVKVDQTVYSVPDAQAAAALFAECFLQESGQP